MSAEWDDLVTAAVADMQPQLGIEDGYLVERVDACTCDPHYGAHHPYCGVEPLQRLDNLPGWPGAERDALAARLAAVEAAFENLPILLSAIESDLRRTPKGRGGEAHFIPATPGHGKSGCPGDNITRWLNEVRAVLSAAPTDTTKEN